MIYIRILSNRAATYLQLNRLTECVADCTSGIEEIEREELILKDEIKQLDGNEEERRVLKVKMLVRRAAALGADGLTDLKLALLLDASIQGLIDSFQVNVQLCNNE